MTDNAVSFFRAEGAASRQRQSSTEGCPIFSRLMEHITKHHNIIGTARRGNIAKVGRSRTGRGERERGDSSSARGSQILHGKLVIGSSDLFCSRLAGCGRQSNEGVSVSPGSHYVFCIVNTGTRTSAGITVARDINCVGGFI